MEASLVSFCPYYVEEGFCQLFQDICLPEECDHEGFNPGKEGEKMICHKALAECLECQECEPEEEEPGQRQREEAAGEWEVSHATNKTDAM